MMYSFHFCFSFIASGEFHKFFFLNKEHTLQDNFIRNVSHVVTSFFFLLKVFIL